MICFFLVSFSSSLFCFFSYLFTSIPTILAGILSLVIHVVVEALFVVCIK